MCLTSTGRVVFYGACGRKSGLPMYPTVICRNMEQHIHFTRIVTTSEIWAMFDEDEEFYLARHELDRDPINIPSEIFGGQSVTDVAFGCRHVLFSTSDNSLFHGGFDVDFLGDGHDVDLRPFADILGKISKDSVFTVLRKVDKQAGKNAGRVLGISCTRNISGFWTEEGVWLWGREASALLAHDEHENHVDMMEQDKLFHKWPDVKNPTKVPHLHLQGKCKQFSMSETHAGALDGNGNVHLWGQNQCGQLATNDKTFRYRPCTVNGDAFGGDGVKSLNVCDSNTTFLTATGNVWTVGYFPGSTDETLRMWPRSVFGGERVREIEGSNWQIAAINECGALYKWGLNRGQTQWVLKGCESVHDEVQIAIPREVNNFWFGSEAVGHWVRWERGLALTMATHARLGAQSKAMVLLPEILRHILLLCVFEA